jgi:hypothetical protein
MAIIIISLGILVINGLIVGLQFNNLPPEIPLWYSLTEGSGAIAGKRWIWTIVALGLLVWISNLGLCLAIKKDEDKKILQKVIGCLTVVWELLLLIVAVRIIILIT